MHTAQHVHGNALHGLLTYRQKHYVNSEAKYFLVIKFELTVAPRLEHAFLFSEGTKHVVGYFKQGQYFEYES